jgi:hypothetical protein
MFERLQALKSDPPDSWVALSEDESRIVAIASSYEEAGQKSDQQAFPTP